jgi:hypothetical protein
MVVPYYYHEAVQIRAMDILQDEICIKDNSTGTIIYDVYRIKQYNLQLLEMI